MADLPTLLSNAFAASYTCICGVCVGNGVGGGVGDGGSSDGGGGGGGGGRGGSCGGSGGSCVSGGFSVKSLKKSRFLRLGDAKLPKNPLSQV